MKIHVSFPIPTANLNYCEHFDSDGNMHKPLGISDIFTMEILFFVCAEYVDMLCVDFFFLSTSWTWKKSQPVGSSKRFYCEIFWKLLQAFCWRGFSMIHFFCCCCGCSLLIYNQLIMGFLPEFVNYLLMEIRGGFKEFNYSDIDDWFSSGFIKIIKDY